jgi:hypothetical protein
VDQVEPLGFLKSLIPRILKPDHPLIASIPWETAGRHAMFPYINTVKAKAGSETLANMVLTTSGEEYPFLVWWDVGEGRSFTMTTSYYGLEAGSWREINRWEYYIDWQVDLHLFLASQPIPPNPEIIHSLRKNLWDFRIKRGLLDSMIEFASSWGGNPQAVWGMLSGLNNGLREVETKYLEQDFNAAMTLVGNLWVELEEVDRAALELKNQTLIWVYLTEWLALTGTAMITGAMIWGLMVKRRLYKEVGTTTLTKNGFMKMEA